MNTVGAIFSAISSFFGWATGRSTLKNAPDVKAASISQDQVNADAKTAQAIQKQDTNEIQKEIAE